MLASDPAAPGAQRAFRILIADDNRDEVLTLATLLREEKYDVRQVYRGDAVVNLASAFLPDVALLDIGMPGMTGYDVARNLRETLGENCPVLIAITGWSKGADRV